ncbi:CDP-alcohol phosphatidyltransferase family protein [Patescibacteria group bacterium]|nr:CDP-alcohol phosphatidyltransferase family protein [Patescibacteria group bacterium]
MEAVSDPKEQKTLLAWIPRWIHPNHLSFARILLIFPLIWCKDDWLPAISILCFSSIFDILDGRLARFRKETSQIGAMLDATGDKIFILLAIFYACDGVPRVLSWTILTLDLLLTILRPIKRWLDVKADSNWVGAAKTWVQSIAIGFVLTHTPTGLLISYGLFSIAILLAVGSLLRHLWDIFLARRTSSTR